MIAVCCISVISDNCIFQRSNVYLCIEYSEHRDYPPKTYESSKKHRRDTRRRSFLSAENLIKSPAKCGKQATTSLVDSMHAYNERCKRTIQNRIFHKSLVKVEHHVWARLSCIRIISFIYSYARCLALFSLAAFCRIFIVIFSVAL